MVFTWVDALNSSNNEEITVNSKRIIVLRFSYLSNLQFVSVNKSSLTE